MTSKARRIGRLVKNYCELTPKDAAYRALNRYNPDSGERGRASARLVHAMSDLLEKQRGDTEPLLTNKLVVDWQGKLNVATDGAPTGEKEVVMNLIDQIQKATHRRELRM